MWASHDINWPIRNSISFSVSSKSIVIGPARTFCFFFRLRAILFPGKKKKAWPFPFSAPHLRSTEPTATTVGTFRTPSTGLRPHCANGLWLRIDCPLTWSSRSKRTEWNYEDWPETSKWAMRRAIILASTPFWAPLLPCAGSHLSNSVTQFCKVLTGTMQRTRLEPVTRRKISVKLMTCRVFPKPMEWAKIQPKPAELRKRFKDSIILSYKNRMPPIWK